METKKIKIKEVLELEVQLNGLKGEGFEIKGLLNEKLNIKTKYWLGKIFDQVQSEKKSFSTLREELIKKYGEEKDGSFQVNPLIDGKQNKNFTKFFEELNVLLDQEVEMKFPKMSIDDFDLETDGNYTFLLSYLID